MAPWAVYQDAKLLWFSTQCQELNVAFLFFDAEETSVIFPQYLGFF